MKKNFGLHIYIDKLYQLYHFKNNLFQCFRKSFNITNRLYEKDFFKLKNYIKKYQFPTSCLQFIKCHHLQNNFSKTE